MKTKLRHRISVKLILTISAILIFALGLYTYLSITRLKSYLTQNSFQHAIDISEVIKKSTRYSMLLNRREDVHQIIRTIGTEPGVQVIRIYNKLGVIIFSTDSVEINKRVNLNAEACIGCHNSSVPSSNLSRQSKLRIFKNGNSQRMLGLINPIQNENDCSSGDCHAHAPQIKVLGVLDVVLSLDSLDKVIAANIKSTIASSILITIIIAATCGVFIILLVNKPMRILSRGMEELGNGNLNYRISINSQNEFGKISHRFNDMSIKLDAAYKEIKDWSENLNKKVQQKSEELKSIYNQVFQIEKLASLGKLSATVAHELNNPLEGILTYSKLISKKLNASQINGEYKNLIEYLDLIADESSRCGKIVKDLLLFSHKEDDEFNNADLISIVNRSITLVNHHLEIHQIKLVKNYEQDYIELNCNPQKIQQAVMSLLINAIESMTTPGEINLDVFKEESHAVIKITDQGYGIDPKDLPHIFEPFYSTKEASKGTGLGLAVVYGIITHHNGEIVVEKTSKEGTTFRVTLPIKILNS